MLPKGQDESPINQVSKVVWWLGKGGQIRFSSKISVLITNWVVLFEFYCLSIRKKNPQLISMDIEDGLKKQAEIHSMELDM